MSFGDALRKYRSLAGLSQEELGARIGRHRTQVNRLENGASAPTWATVQRLAKALGVDCTAFGDGALPATPPKGTASRAGKKKG